MTEKINESELVCTELSDEEKEIRSILNKVVTQKNTFSTTHFIEKVIYTPKYYESENPNEEFPRLKMINSKIEFIAKEKKRKSFITKEQIFPSKPMTDIFDALANIISASIELKKANYKFDVVKDLLNTLIISLEKGFNEQ